MRNTGVLTLSSVTSFTERVFLVWSVSLSGWGLIYSYHLRCCIYGNTKYSVSTHTHNTRLGRLPFHSSELHLLLNPGTDRVRHLVVSAAWLVCGKQRNVINSFITRRQKRHIAHSWQHTCEVGEESGTTQAHTHTHMLPDKYQLSGYDLCLCSPTEAKELETDSLAHLFLYTSTHHQTCSHWWLAEADWRVRRGCPLSGT